MYASTCDLFFFYCSVDHRDLHSFPTRRSSDLSAALDAPIVGSVPDDTILHVSITFKINQQALDQLNRSEEHTSELQSLTNLVCRLLLEKKKGDRQSPYETAPKVRLHKDYMRIL